MSALASMLLDLGWRISGSDCRGDAAILDLLRKRGAQISSHHAAANLPHRTDLLIYSAAIPETNPERNAARGAGVREMSYSQALGHLMQDRVGICIAGTHGKSTTSAMIASILQTAGRSPSACLGAALCDSQQNGWAGIGDLFVVESCEYRRSFLDLRPTYAAILNIEPDHFDYFRDEADLHGAFCEFAARVARDGLLVVRDDEEIKRIAVRSTSARIETFSTSANCDWGASQIRRSGGQTRFRVDYRGTHFADFLLTVPGTHNVLNALAAIAVCRGVGLTALEIRESLAAYRGIRRRFEHVGDWRGVTFIDDYAHHPTAVRATLQAAREQFGPRRIWCVFQPHQSSRTVALMEEFATSFADADETLIAPVYHVRENEVANDCLGQNLALRIRGNGRRARAVAALDRIAATLEDETRAGDVVIVMGAGDIDRVHHDFTRRLQRHRAS